MSAECKILVPLVAFCQQPHQPCFSGWPPVLISDYLQFHAKQGTLAFVLDDNEQPVGMAVGWQCNEIEILRPEYLQNPFYWQATNPKGNAFVVAQIICTKHWAVSALVIEFIRRFPHWRELTLFAARRGKLVQYEKERLFTKLYGIGKGV